MHAENVENEVWDEDCIVTFFILLFLMPLKETLEIFFLIKGFKSKHINEYESHFHGFFVYISV